MRTRLLVLEWSPLNSNGVQGVAGSDLPTVRYCPLGTQKSGNGDRQDAGDSGSCPMKTGPAPDFVCWLTAPDKREVGSSTLPRPINFRSLPRKRLHVCGVFA
jgi:hypothetical protein